MAGIDDSTLDVALVVPLHGSAGIFGPSCELCAQLAVEDINGGAGVLAATLAVACSIAFGISTTLVIAAACYLLLIPAALTMYVRTTASQAA